MCSGCDEGSFLRLTDSTPPNSRLESNKEGRRQHLSKVDAVTCDGPKAIKNSEIKTNLAMKLIHSMFFTSNTKEFVQCTSLPQSFNSMLFSYKIVPLQQSGAVREYRRGEECGRDWHEIRGLLKIKDMRMCRTF